MIFTCVYLFIDLLHLTQNFFYASATIRWCWRGYVFMLSVRESVRDVVSVIPVVCIVGFSPNLSVVHLGTEMN